MKNKIGYSILYVHKKDSSKLRDLARLHDLAMVLKPKPRYNIVIEKVKNNLLLVSPHSQNGFLHIHGSPMFFDPKPTWFWLQFLKPKPSYSIVIEKAYECKSSTENEKTSASDLGMFDKECMIDRHINTVVNATLSYM